MTSGCCDETAKKNDPAPCGGEKTVSRIELAVAPCCPGGEAKASYHDVPVEGRLSTPVGEVPRVATRWRLRDWGGRLVVRLGFRRMSYAVAPGLYAVGQPGPDSPVLVSANYKLSFDILRRAIEGLDVWILVLDTRGVNVWCAAGKGTFGTAELARRVEATRLAQVVGHRRLVVPQLGAPSVAAREVERLTGFGVVFGPVRAADIPEFLARDFRANPAMRRVTFGLGDRIEVAGLELVTAGRAVTWLSALVLALTAWNGAGFSWTSAWGGSAPILLALWGGLLAGTVLFAALLPWLPGRMFAVKGAFPGALVTATSWIGGRGLLPDGTSAAVPLALALVTIAMSSYLGANFTGSSTFTSLSGVKRELRLAIPVIATALVVATVLPVAALLVGGIVR